MKANRLTTISAASFAIVALAFAQAPAQRPQVVSPEVQSDRHIVFRIVAPQIETVKVSGGDIPGNGPGTPMTKGEKGVGKPRWVPSAPARTATFSTSTA